MLPYERSTSSSAATARARSRSVSATATSFACGTARATFSACRFPITPTPHTATFNRATGASFEQLDNTGAPEQCQACYASSQSNCSISLGGSGGLHYHRGLPRRLFRGVCSCPRSGHHQLSRYRFRYGLDDSRIRPKRVYAVLPAAWVG